MSIESQIANATSDRAQAHRVHVGPQHPRAAIGVGALLISIALLSGLQGQIKNRLIESSPQILVEPAGSNTVENADAIVEGARALGMRDVRPYVSGIAWGANEAAELGRPMRVRCSPRPRAGNDRGATGRPREWHGDEAQIYVTRGYAASLRWMPAT
jgi:hypothetical protein